MFVLSGSDGSPVGAIVGGVVAVMFIILIGVTIITVAITITVFCRGRRENAPQIEYVNWSSRSLQIMLLFDQECC